MEVEKLNGYEIVDRKARNNIEEINNELPTKKNSINYRNYPEILGQKSRYVIDGINGSDENPGTADLPFKTIDKFFELLNQGLTDIRCNIVSAGIYKATKTIFSNAIIHITAKTPGVVIEFQNENISGEEYCATTFYNCHLNILGYSQTEPITLKNSNNSVPIYTENCSNWLESINIENCSYFAFWGNFTRLQYASVPCIYFNGCNSDVYGLTITEHDKAHGIVIRYGAHVVLRGVLNYVKTESDKYALVVERSTLIAHPTINNTEYITTAYGLNITYAIVHSATTNFNKMKGLSETNSIVNSTITLGNIQNPA